MRYVAAYLLAAIGGNADPSVADIEKILSSVGIEMERDLANKVVSQLKGKSIPDVIAAGKEKLASVPSGGAPAAGGGGGGGADGGAADAPAAEEKKAEKEESEESDDDMGFGLFD